MTAEGSSAAFDGAIKGMESSNALTLASQSDTTLNGHPARIFALNKDAYSIAGILVLVGDNLYMTYGTYAPTVDPAGVIGLRCRLPGHRVAAAQTPLHAALRGNPTDSAPNQVPELPLTIATAFSRAPMAANRPPLETNSAQARTFGAIDPDGHAPEARPSLASSTESRRIGSWRGVPQRR
jgi:hypothetical protein